MEWMVVAVYEGLWRNGKRLVELLHPKGNGPSGVPLTSEVGVLYNEQVFVR